MQTYERAGLWVVMIVVAIFTFSIHGRVGDLKTTVQDHTATLDQPVLEAVVFPGVPAALAERWTKATQGTDLTPQDHLWLTLHLTNLGRSNVVNMTADLSLLTAIRGIHPYPYSQAPWNTPKVAEGGKGQRQVKLTFRSMSPDDTHTVFIALRPDDMAGPPYTAEAKRQWVAQHQVYWKQLTITVGGKPMLVQYGLASPWIPITQHETSNRGS
jgi:hypothetical protein